MRSRSEAIYCNPTGAGHHAASKENSVLLIPGGDVHSQTPEQGNPTLESGSPFNVKPAEAGG